MMDGPFLKIGARLSIISKANVRYEGIFVEIDTVNLQIALSDVHFFGTESRAAEVYIAGQDRVYPYVIFKSTDISDIHVIKNVNVNEIPLPVVTGFRRDYPQSTLEFLRTFPLSRLDISQNFLQSPNGSSPPQHNYSSQRGIWTRSSQTPCSRNYRRGYPYMWRIPRVFDFIGRSGVPSELPDESKSTNSHYGHDFDFEKNNKLFEKILNGMKGLNLKYDSDNDESSSVSDEVQRDQENDPHEDEESKKEVVADVSQGATPKKYNVSSDKPKLTPSAYNKNKSFFDTVSCSSIYRSPNSNPNWREWNKETFGVPMIRHHRRRRPSSTSMHLNAVRDVADSKTAETDGGKPEKNIEKVIKDVEPEGESQTEENVTVQKIRFQAIVVTKSRSIKSSSNETHDSNYEKKPVNANENDDGEKYSLKKFK